MCHQHPLRGLWTPGSTVRPQGSLHPFPPHPYGLTHQLPETLKLWEALPPHSRESQLTKCPLSAPSSLAPGRWRDRGHDCAAATTTQPDPHTERTPVTPPQLHTDTCGSPSLFPRSHLTPGPPSSASKAQCSVTVQRGDMPAPTKVYATLAGSARCPPTTVPAPTPHLAPPAQLLQQVVAPPATPPALHLQVICGFLPLSWPSTPPDPHG